MTGALLTFLALIVLLGGVTAHRKARVQRDKLAIGQNLVSLALLTVWITGPGSEVACYRAQLPHCRRRSDRGDRLVPTQTQRTRPLRLADGRAQRTTFVRSAQPSRQLRAATLARPAACPDGFIVGRFAEPSGGLPLQHERLHDPSSAQN